MGVKKFIQNALESLNMKNFELKRKKKSLKTLLSKLKKKRLKVLNELEFESDQEKRALIKEELELITFHLEKGKKKLLELKNK
ncbi:MAG: hypothetical protein U9Q40_06070 [Campylobacterota bacterium]|nr:hypothetical protein [Campylobacterota bacterium]